MNQAEIVQEMEATKAAIELVEQTDPDDLEGLRAMRERVSELTEMLKQRSAAQSRGVRGSEPECEQLRKTN